MQTPAEWALLAAARREVGSDTEELATVAVPLSTPQTLAAGAAAAVNRAPKISSVKVGKPASDTGLVTGKVTATDADKDPVVFSGSGTTAKGGTVVIDPSSGAFAYTPAVAARHAAALKGAPSSTKTDTFTVTVFDPSGATASKLVTVSLSPLNAVPTVAASPTVNSPDSSGVVTGSLGAADADHDALKFTATPKKGTVAFGDGGSFTYTPTAQARHAASVPGAKSSATSETFTVTVTDGHGGTVSKAVTVNIAPANVAPTGLTASAATPNTKTGVVTGKFVATDADQDKLVFSGTSTAKGKVVVNAKTGTFTYTPTAAARHAASAATASPHDLKDSITLSVSDGHGGIATTTVEVAILSANKAPKVTATAGKPNTTTGVVTGTIKATDADKDTLTYVALADTAKGTVIVNPTTGAFTYTPSAAARHAASMTGAPKAVKQDSFTVTVTDGHGGSTTKLVTVAIAPANTAPALVGTPTVNTPNLRTGIVTGTLEAADADGDALAFKASPKKGTITFDAGGSFTYTPTTAAQTAAAKPNASISAKQETFTVTVTDGFGGTTTTKLTVAIAPAGYVNSAPVNGTMYVSSPDSITGVVSGMVTATDPDGDTVKYSAPATTAKGSITINATTGAFTYTPTSAARHAAAANNAPASATTDSFVVTVTDGWGGTDHAWVTVAVLPANNPPTGGVVTGLSIDTVTGTVTGTITGVTDVDGDTLSYSAPFTSSSGGTVRVNATTGAFTYTPTQNAQHSATATSADTFTVTIDDAHGGQTATFVVVPIDPGVPIVGTVTLGVPDFATGVLTGVVVFADNAGRTLSYSAPATSAGGGIVTVGSSTGTFSYTPTKGQRQSATATTTDTFVVTASNGVHATTTTVTVRVDAGTPVVGTPTAGSPDPNTGVVTGSAVFTDSVGRPLTYSAPIKSTGGGTVSVDASTGTYIFTPTQSQRLTATTNTTDTFTLTANNGVNTASQIVRVAVHPGILVAGTPTVGTPDPTTGSVSGSLGFVHTAGRPLTYAVSNSPAKGSVTVNAAGVVTYTPTLAARLAAGRSLEPVTDTFVVTANDGISHIAQTVTVPVTGNWVSGVITVGRSPAGIVISPNGKYAYVLDSGTSTSGGYTGSLSVISIASGRVLAPLPGASGATVPLDYYANGSGAASDAVAISPDGKRVYISHNFFYGGAPQQVGLPGSITGLTGSGVFIINPVPTNYTDVTGAIRTGNIGTKPSGLAVGPDSRHLYIAVDDTANNVGRLAVVDTATNNVTKTITVGPAPRAVAISPDGSLVYVANTHYQNVSGTTTPGENTVSVINTTTNTVVATISAGQNPSALAFSPNGTLAYIGGENRVSVVNTTTSAVVATIPVTSAVAGVTFSPDGSLAYIAGSHRVAVVNTATNTIIQTIQIDAPKVGGVAISPDGNYLYVTASPSDSQARGSVIVISL